VRQDQVGLKLGKAVVGNARVGEQAVAEARLGSTPELAESGERNISGIQFQ
jgi:hypothetical protein